MRKFAFVLAAIAAVAFSVRATPSAQAYVPHHHHHHLYNHHHVARNGSRNWSSDRLNGHGINGLGVTTNSGRKYNGG